MKKIYFRFVNKIFHKKINTDVQILQPVGAPLSVLFFHLKQNYKTFQIKKIKLLEEHTQAEGFEKLY